MEVLEYYEAGYVSYNTMRFCTSRYNFLYDEGKVFDLYYTGFNILYPCLVGRSSTPSHASLSFNDHINSIDDHYNDVRHLKVTGDLTVFGSFPKFNQGPYNPFAQACSWPVVLLQPGIYRTFVADDGSLLTFQSFQIDSYLTVPVIAFAATTRRESGKTSFVSIQIYVWDESAIGQSSIYASWMYSTKSLKDFDAVNVYAAAQSAYLSRLHSVKPELRNWSSSTKSLSPLAPPKLRFSSNYLDYFPNKSWSVNWNQLAATAYEDLGFWEGNGLAYINDVREAGKSVMSTLATIKQLGRGKMKAIANLYLSFHYGYSLFLRDTSSLLQQLDRDLSVSRCQASQTVSYPNGITVDARYQCYYRPYGQLSNMLKQLLDYSDLSLEVSNLWDMVPFSFVIDWFTNIGDILESIDNYMSLLQYHLPIACGKSYKLRRKLPLPALPTGQQYYSSVIPEVCYYSRSYFSDPVGPEYHLSVSNPLTSLPNHWKEAGALYVSKT